jgi:signal transduction histidine kinase
VSREEFSRQGVFAAGAGGKSAGPGVRILLCGTEEFCAEVRRELRRRRPEVSVGSADALETARTLVEHEPPSAILAEDRVLAGGAVSLRQRRQAIAAGLTLLAGHAPVVWVGGAEDGAEISRALPAGPVDFVPRSALCLAAAVTMLERRLRVAVPGLAAEAVKPGGIPMGEVSLENRDFGEVLRHELNNPLTGILGNAELLLLEVRRGHLEMAPHNLQRLEIIAELAVRMRETVRQLSDRWQSAGGELSTENPAPANASPWPVSG